MDLAQACADDMQRVEKGSRDDAIPEYVDPQGAFIIGDIDTI